MSETVIGALLIVLVAFSALQLALVVALWRGNYALRERVSRLEALQLSHQEIRGIYDRLGTIEGRMTTTVQMMQSIQEHLLENDP